MQHTIRFTGLAIFGVLTAGCYVLLPAGGAAVPAPGTPIVMQVSDAGRLGLGGTMGPEIQRVEGRLINRENGDYQVSVSSVSLVGGGTQVWSGETVLIKGEYVSAMYEKRLAKGRTVALSAAIALGVTAFAMSRDLFGFGREHNDSAKVDTSITSNRGPRQAPPVRRFKPQGVF